MLVGGGEKKTGPRAGRLHVATRVMTLLVSVPVVLLKARRPAACPLLAPARVVQPATQACACLRRAEPRGPLRYLVLRFRTIRTLITETA